MKPTSVSLGSRPRTLAARTAARNEPPSARATSRQCSHRHEKSVALGAIQTPFSLLIPSPPVASRGARPPGTDRQGCGGAGQLPRWGDGRDHVVYPARWTIERL